MPGVYFVVFCVTCNQICYYHFPSPGFREAFASTSVDAICLMFDYSRTPADCVSRWLPWSCLRIICNGKNTKDWKVMYSVNR